LLTKINELKRGQTMKKSQAALEFLTTYSWAFLVIIIMVGALAYFGVLSPSKLLPDRCNFGSEVTCNKDFMVVDNVDATAGAGGPTDNVVSMRLENNVGSSISVTAVTATTDIDSTIIGICASYIHDSAGAEILPTVAAPVTWDADTMRSIVVECVSGSKLIPKEKVKFSLEITYFPTAAGSTYKKSVFGEIFSTIQ